MKKYNKMALIVFAVFTVVGLISAVFNYWMSGPWELSLSIVIYCTFGGISTAFSARLYFKWKHKSPFGRRID